MVLYTKRICFPCYSKLCLIIFTFRGEWARERLIENINESGTLAARWKKTIFKWLTLLGQQHYKLQPTIKYKQL